MRLSRGSSPPPAAAQPVREKSSRLPAWGRELLKRRAAGEAVDLVEVAVGGWPKGRLLEDRFGGALLVFLPDVDLAAADWSLLRGLDVVLDGDAAQDRFDLACLCALRAGAASVWGSAGGRGHVRLEFWPHGAPWLVWADGPVRDIAQALRSWRELLILTQADGYSGAAFVPVREALLADVGLNVDLSLRHGVSSRVLRRQVIAAAGEVDYADATTIEHHANLMALYEDEISRMEAMA